MPARETPITEPLHAAAAWAGPTARQRQLLLPRGSVWWIELGAGPPLVLLHGYGGTARWWVRNLSALAEWRRVYALDVPGFGRSSAPRPFSFPVVADLLADWMAANLLPAADIVAHSMGGQLAMILAARHPQRVRSLLLASPAGLPSDTGLPGIARSAFLSRTTGDPRFTRIVIAGMLRTGPRVLWQAVQQIRAVDVRPYLAAIVAPTLILWGDQDRLLPVANGPVLAAAIPGARLRIIPGGRHNVMFEDYELFNAATLEFLTAVTPALSAMEQS